MNQHFDLIVIGEGVSALACAGHAARSGLSVATFEANLYGGLVLNIQELDGWPEAKSGTDLATELMMASVDAGATSIQAPVVALRQVGEGFEVVTGDSTYGARQVVIASGAKLKALGVPGESEYEGRGVSHCADCDGAMFQDEDVVVVGGGDSAFQEALVLAQHCRSVRILVRGDAWRARPHLAERVLATPGISIVANTTVEAILGGKTVERIRVRRNGQAEEIAAAGLFAYIGLAPNSGFVPPEISRDAEGRILTDANLATSLPGAWAIGAVRAGYSGLLVDAVAEAERVADAIRRCLPGAG
jgi:thioredoxin reductase (NADPH)